MQKSNLKFITDTCAHTNKFVLLYVQKKNTKLKAIFQSQLRKGITHDYSVSLERVLLHFRKKRLITFHFLSQKHINFSKRFFSDLPEKFWERFLLTHLDEVSIPKPITMSRNTENFG